MILSPNLFSRRSGSHRNRTLSKCLKVAVGMPLVLIVLCACAAEAADRYVTPAGAGAKTGSDWSDACDGFTGTCNPTGLARGDTYFVADGDYRGDGNLIFSTSISGTLVITIRKATAASHGSEIGWSDPMGDGQAVFRSWTVTTSHWLFTGVNRDESNWRDVSAYGFRVDNSTIDGKHNPLGSVNIGAGSCVSSITVQYVDVVGSGKRGATDDGFRIVGYYDGSCRSNNILVARNAIHDGGEGDSVTARAVNNLTVEYNWMARNSPVTSHAQGADIMSASIVHWRYNVLEDIAGTSYFATPDQSSGLTPSSDYHIYGNVFMRREGSTWPCSAYVIGLINTRTEHTGAFYVYNNTIVRMNAGGCFGNEGATLFVHPEARVAGATIRVYNNLTWNSTGFNAQLIGGQTRTDWSHNAYFAMLGTMSDSDPASVTGIADPFVNSANNDFRLRQPQASGMSLPAPFNFDLLGIQRGIDATWERGAFEITGPRGPTNLRIIR